MTTCDRCPRTEWSWSSRGNPGTGLLAERRQKCDYSGGANVSKSRIDALTDGLFGVAMTILVLDLRLPDAFHADQAGLIGALRGLWPKFLPTP